MKVYLWIK